MAPKRSVKKVLLLGSGALKIGEAGEFDYSGSQAMKALKEEGIEIVLVNPNIATNQTSRILADKIYFLPVEPKFIEKIIIREKPDGVLLGFGGQTALNCGLALEKNGTLKKYNVRVLGTPVSAIQVTEDRELFKKAMTKIGLSVPRSLACNSKKEALAAAKKIGYPVITRAAFALGGKGSGFAYSEKELTELLDSAFAASPQVLIEENLKGWKEIEYEVVRDQFDNCITVCNMENIDPLGIHTGESIVIAPSQTLTNREYHMLREISIKAIRSLEIIGECNIQYALHPESNEYRVIEVNARLSRSSALASKATGYPLAHIAAKLSLGHALPTLKNAVTRTTTACFEPALDYVALKIPRWDLDKFRKVSQQISTEMKSVGEVMALGRSFEEVLQKGLRMLQVGFHGFTGNDRLNIAKDDFSRVLTNPTPKRIIALAEALKQGWTTQKINKCTGIDLWFLEKMKNIVDTEEKMKNTSKIEIPLLQHAKKLGFSDKQIASLKNTTEDKIRALRQKLRVVPVVKQIDTLAAEYPAKTNYLYLTYHGEKNDILPARKTNKKKVIVLGSGAYCIGSSVEFDWCSVTAVQTLAKEGYETIMINYNPETVSTDYDICDKLYFDELSLERVLDIIDHEKPYGVIISTGGQIPNNLALKLNRTGVHILGTNAVDIDRAEDRHKFSALLDRIGVLQPQWKEFARPEDAFIFADKVGYPVLVRPSYVLSGAAMRVAKTPIELQHYLEKAAKVSTAAPVVISKFESGAKEIEIDAVAHKGKLVIWAVTEHIENAGVHSGDATIVLPPQKLYIETIRRIREIAKKIAKELNITGPFNIQFLAKSNQIKVIECNLRASRSFPFASKVTGYNFIEIAIQAMIGKTDALKQNYRTLDLDHVGVKVSQFSFSRLKGADPILGVEMASTGEVACFGADLHEAFLKAMLSAGFVMPKKKHILLSIGRLEDKVAFLTAAQKLHAMGYRLSGTEGTAQFLAENNIPCRVLAKVGEKSSSEPSLLEELNKKTIDLVINIPKTYSEEEITAGYRIRRKTIDLNIPLITNIQLAKVMVDALEKYTFDTLAIKHWAEYVPHV